MKAIAERQERIQYLTRDEWGRLLKAIDSPRDRAIFLAAYTYGLRASEVGMIRTADIDFARDRIYVHRLKGSISGEWPLLPNVAKAIKRWVKTRQKLGFGNKTVLFVSRQGTPIDRSSLHLLMRKYGGRAGIPSHKQHFHALKHTRAMHLLEQTHDIVGVKDWLGHKSIQSTMKYVQILGFQRFEFAGQLKA